MNRRHLVSLSLGVGALLLAAEHAFGQTANCGDHDGVTQILRDRYGETVQSMGVTASGALVEVFASLESGTWTITVTTAGGPTCLVASGTAFQSLPPEPAGDPA